MALWFCSKCGLVDNQTPGLCGTCGASTGFATAEPQPQQSDELLRQMLHDTGLVPIVWPMPDGTPSVWWVPPDFAAEYAARKNNDDETVEG